MELAAGALNKKSIHQVALCLCAHTKSAEAPAHARQCEVRVASDMVGVGEQTACLAPMLIPTGNCLFAQFSKST